MAFEAHPVTKERWPDLVELFDRPIVRTRFCMFYRKTRTGTGVGLENRQAMKALVDRGTVPGLIGYENGVPVAWVSLGPREDYAKLRRSPVMKPVDDRPVWSIVCFFVDRRARGRSLSERMLGAAVDFARSCGARLVEAYPVDKDERSHPDDMFFGAKSMYDRAGFREVARRRPTRPVLRKVLRPGRSATEPRARGAGPRLLSGRTAIALGTAPFVSGSVVREPRSRPAALAAAKIGSCIGTSSSGGAKPMDGIHPSQGDR